MKVEFFSFDYAPAWLKESWLKSFNETIIDGAFIGGSKLKEFEENFASQLGVDSSIGVSNGFDALEVALRALGIGVGHKVAIPAHTFIATWNAVLAVGATPLGIDVSDDAQIDVQKFNELIKRESISCVIPVHMHGHMSDFKLIRSICDDSGLVMVEDASQAHFAHRDGYKAGTLGEIGIFSLYPTKNLGALGDAGIVVTKDRELELRIRSMINYGSSASNKYDHYRLGYNKRLDSLQASILNNNLQYIDEWNAWRQELAGVYSDACTNLEIPFLAGRDGSVWHHFCIFSKNRDELKRFLMHLGVMSEIHYPNVAAYEVAQFANLERGNFPIAEKIATTSLSIPLSQFHSKEMIHYVVDCLRKAKNLSLI